MNLTQDWLADGEARRVGKKFTEAASQACFMHDEGLVVSVAAKQPSWCSPQIIRRLSNLCSVIAHCTPMRSGTSGARISASNRRQISKLREAAGMVARRPISPQPHLPIRKTGRRGDRSTGRKAFVLRLQWQQTAQGQLYTFVSSSVYSP
jgi:hypothetical protein